MIFLMREDGMSDIVLLVALRYCLISTTMRSRGVAAVGGVATYFCFEVTHEYLVISSANLVERECYL